MRRDLPLVDLLGTDEQVIIDRETYDTCHQADDQQVGTADVEEIQHKRIEGEEDGDAVQRCSLQICFLGSGIKLVGDDELHREHTRYSRRTKDGKGEELMTIPAHACVQHLGHNERDDVAEEDSHNEVGIHACRGESSSSKRVEMPLRTNGV